MIFRSFLSNHNLHIHGIDPILNKIILQTERSVFSHK